MSSAITDPEVLDFIELTGRYYPENAVALTIEEQRRVYDRMSAAMRQPRPPSVAVEQGGIDGPGGIIPVRRYWGSGGSSIRVVYFHGGGFILGGLDSHDDVCAEIADRCGVEVVSVDYRLCPEHPHPAAFKDALAAVDFFSDKPLIVVGDSAGGNLAAAVALRRPRKIAAQVLIYPGLGGETFDLPSYIERANAPMLTADDVTFYRNMRVNGDAPLSDPTLMPLAAKNISLAPPCFVSSAEYDPLRDDGPKYVLMLSEAGIAAEAVVEAELPHGHLRARHISRRAGEAFSRICAAIRDFAEA